MERFLNRVSICLTIELIDSGFFKTKDIDVFDLLSQMPGTKIQYTGSAWLIEHNGVFTSTDYPVEQLAELWLEDHA